MTRAIMACAALLIASPLNAEPGDTSIDTLLSAVGLSDLSESQKIAARSLVRRLVARSAASEMLAESAENYFENEGYRPVHLSIATVLGKNYLIATINGSHYATADLPIATSTLTFKEGDYYAKPGIVGGVSEFIDGSGRVQRLIIARWLLLR